MLLFIILIAISSLCFVIVAMGQSDAKKKVESRKNRIEELLRNNIVTSSYITSDIRYGIGLDNEKNIFIINAWSVDFKAKKIKPIDLIEVELIEDDQSIIKTSRGSQLGGAIVGGILAGGVGAIIGGATGKKTQSPKVKSIKLRIVKNDINHPITEMSFLDSKEFIDKNSQQYKVAYNNAIEWQKKLEIIIRNTEQMN